MGAARILRLAGREYRVTVGDNGLVSVDGTTVQTRSTGPGEVRTGEDEHRAWVAAAGDTRWVYWNGQQYEIEVAGRRRRAGTAAGSLAAPMPATVIRVEVSPGTRVGRGDTLIILEAMKMELPVRAPADGTVAAVLCEPGDLVQPGVPLIEMT